MKTKKLKCRKCGYEWKSKSTMIWVTCPSCQYKSPHKTERFIKETAKKEESVRL